MTDTGTPSAPAPLLDLQQLAVTIRRRRRLWVSFGLLGLLSGALLAVLVPPTPTAAVRLLVIHAEDQPSDGGNLIRTDIAVLHTTRIAAVALQRLGSPERPADFLEDYEATGLTSNVLELKVKGSSDGDAVARAAALAEAFIADHVQRLQTAADAEAEALIKQHDKARTELAAVEASIAATPDSASPEAAVALESQYARRAELNAQISDLGRRAEEARIGTPRVAAGTQVVDGPRALPRSLPMTGAVNAAVGLVLGLAAGLALAAVTGVVQDRPVLRRDISAHLGASVIAQVPARRRGPAGWLRWRAAAERKRVAATLVRTVRHGPATVSLLELGCPRTAAALALDIAEGLAVDCQVVVVDDLPGRNLRKFKDGAQSPIRIQEGGGMPLPVWPQERHLGVGSVEPGTAWTDLARLGSETLLVVRAGHAGTRWLHTVARQLADFQIPVIGVVLVHPDPRDRTDGTLWNGLHTAIRGRASRAARPAPGPAPEAAAPSREARPGAPAQGGARARRSDDYPTERLPAVTAATPAEVEIS